MSNNVIFSTLYDLFSLYTKFISLRISFFIISFLHILHPSFQTIKKAVLDLAFPFVDKQQKRLYFFYIYKKADLSLSQICLHFLFIYFCIGSNPSSCPKSPKSIYGFLSLFFTLKIRKKPASTSFTALSSILSVLDGADNRS